jgi:hypothetical protein
MQRTMSELTHHALHARKQKSAVRVGRPIIFGAIVSEISDSRLVKPLGILSVQDGLSERRCFPLLPMP